MFTMWYRRFPALLAVFFSFISCIQASSDCGRLDESQLKNGKLITEPNEHSWIGLIDRNAECLAILIDVRHALVPGNCIIAENPNVSISFGIRDSSYISVETPQRVPVSEIQVDPESDLTLLTLKNDVVLSVSVQPICLPSVEDLRGDKSEEDLILSGYETPHGVPGSTPRYPVEKKRIKMNFEPISGSECNKHIRSLTEELICGTTARIPYPGSALVKATGSPKKFHLIGLLERGFYSTSQGKYVQGHINIPSKLDWIQRALSAEK